MNEFGSWILLILSAALIFFGLHGMKIAKQRQKMIKELFNIMRECLKEIGGELEDSGGNGHGKNTPQSGIKRGGENG